MHRTLNIYVRGHKGVSQKVYGLKHVYYKYIETKVALRINVTPPPDLNAQVPAFHTLFYSVRKKKTFFLVASLTNFAPRQWLLHRMKIFLDLIVSFIFVRNTLQ